MTALEIYREDRQNRRNPQARRPRQEYFLLLRDALHEELTGEGRSEFLEEMIAECSGKALPVLEFAALRECFAAIVDGRSMKDASEFVPHILRGEDQPLRWSDLDKGPSFRVDDPMMPDMLLWLRNVSWQLVSARDQTPATGAERAVSREIAGLRAVNRALETDNNELRAEQEKLRARIRELEEGVISQQLQHKIDNRRRQAEEGAAQEMARIRREEERKLREALARAALNARSAREAAQREAAEQAAQRAADYAALQAQLHQALAQQAEMLRQAVHGADHRFLAQSYAALRGMLRRELPLVIGSAQAHGADDHLLEMLTGFDAAVDAQLHQLEQALLQLGLQVFCPAEGERFDGALHSPASARADDAPEGQEIAAVETPGVMLVKAEGQPETLVRAVVHTRPRYEQ